MKYFLPGDFPLFMAGLFMFNTIDDLFRGNYALAFWGFIMALFSWLYWSERREEYFKKLNKVEKSNV